MVANFSVCAPERMGAELGVAARKGRGSLVLRCRGSAPAWLGGQSFGQRVQHQASSVHNSHPLFAFLYLAQKTLRNVCTLALSHFRERGVSSSESSQPPRRDAGLVPVFRPHSWEMVLAQLHYLHAIIHKTSPFLHSDPGCIRCAARRPLSRLW